MTVCKIYANVGTADSALGVGDFLEIDPLADSIIFTAGSDTVDEGEPIPSSTQLNQAGVILTGSQVIVDKYFVADDSENELREIQNMGNQNKRYVLAVDFTGGETISEPVLEVWDNSDMDSADNISLGEGTPSNSWFRGIVTTDALPGEDWVGSRLAGSSDGYFLFLNNLSGALTVAKTLYCQLKVVIPATATQGGAEQNVIAVKYAA